MLLLKSVAPTLIWAIVLAVLVVAFGGGLTFGIVVWRQTETGGGRLGPGESPTSVGLTAPESNDTLVGHGSHPKPESFESTDCHYHGPSVQCCNLNSSGFGTASSSLVPLQNFAPAGPQHDDSVAIQKELHWSSLVPIQIESVSLPNNITPAPSVDTAQSSMSSLIESVSLPNNITSAPSVDTATSNTSSLISHDVPDPIPIPDTTISPSASSDHESATATVTTSPSRFQTMTAGTEHDLTELDGIRLLMANIQACLEPLRSPHSLIEFNPTELCALLQRYSEAQARPFLHQVQFRVRHYEPFLDAVRAAYAAEVDRAQRLLISVTESESVDPLSTDNIGYVEYRALRDRSGLHHQLRSVIKCDDGVNLVLSQTARGLTRRLRHSLERTVEEHTDTEAVLNSITDWAKHVQTVCNNDTRGPHRAVLDMAKAEIALRTASLRFSSSDQQSVPIDTPICYVPLIPAGDGVRVRVPTRTPPQIRWHQRCLERLDAVLAPANRTALTQVTERRLRRARAYHDVIFHARQAVIALLAAIKSGSDQVPVNWDAWQSYWTTAASKSSDGLPLETLVELHAELSAVFLLWKQWSSIQRIADSDTATLTNLASTVEMIASMYGSCAQAVRDRLLLLERCVDIGGRTLHELKQSVDVTALFHRNPPHLTEPAVRTLTSYQNCLPSKQSAAVRFLAERLVSTRNPAHRTASNRSGILTSMIPII